MFVRTWTAADGHRAHLAFLTNRGTERQGAHKVEVFITRGELREGMTILFSLSLSFIFHTVSLSLPPSLSHTSSLPFLSSAHSVALCSSSPSLCAWLLLLCSPHLVQGIAGCREKGSCCPELTEKECFFRCCFYVEGEMRNLKPNSPWCRCLFHADEKWRGRGRSTNASVSLCSQILPAPLPTPAQLFVAFVSHCYIQSKIGILYKPLSVFIDRNG